MRIYLFIAAVAGGVTYLLTPLIRHIAIEIGAVGEVRARDVHTVPTPPSRECKFIPVMD